jgi:hypothetical protein
LDEVPFSDPLIPKMYVVDGLKVKMLADLGESRAGRAGRKGAE